MIPPVGHGSLPPSPALRHAAASGGGVEEPRDRVELGVRSVPESPPPPAVAREGRDAPPSVLPAEPPPEPVAPAPDETLRLAARQGLLGGLYALESKFAADALSDEDFQRGAWRLSQAALSEKDPFVRRKAQQVLYDRVQGTTGVADWQLKRGPLDGPLEFLGGRIGSLEWNDHNWFTDESFLPFLDAISEETARGPVPERAVKTVAHLATSLVRRSRQDFTEKIREHETKEDDLRWAGECVVLLEEWWNRGGLQVVRDGRRVRRGAADLLEEAGRGRLAVRGSVVDLTAKPAPPVHPEAAALLEGIKWWEKESCPPADRLEELARQDLAEAAATMAALVALADAAPDREGPSKMARLLREAATRPGLAGLFRPHLGTLATVASRASERGLVAPGNLEGQAKVHLYEALLERFPELATEDMLHRELALLLQSDEINTRNDAGNMMKELWKVHPELVGPTMDLLLAEPAERLETSVSSLALAALEEHGWKPGLEQRDALLSWLYVPPSLQGRSVFQGYESYRFGLDVLKALEEREPGTLDRLRLPDLEGRMVPARRAILERLVQDSSEDVERHLFSPSGGHFLATEAWRLIFPDATLEDELLDRVARGYAEAPEPGAAPGEAGLPPSRLSKMNPEARRALAVLGSLELSPERRARLDRVLAPEIELQQGWYLEKDVVEKTRQRYLAAEVEALKGLPADDRPSRAADLLALVHGTRSGWDAERDSRRLLDTLAPLLPHGGPGVQALLDELRSHSGPLAELPLRGVAALQILDFLPEAREGVGEVVRPHLDEDPGFDHDTVRKVLEWWRWEGAQEDLKSPDVDLARRLQALSGALAESGRRGKDARGRVLDLWEEGLRARRAPWTEELARRIPDRELRARAFAIVAAAAGTDQAAEERFPRFAEMLQRVGGPSRVEDAGRAWSAWERHLQEGVEPREALRIALLEHALDTGEAVPAGTISRGEAGVTIGGVTLPQRPD